MNDDFANLFFAVLATCLLVVLLRAPVNAQEPPFSGTAFLSTEIITSSDPSTFVAVDYIGLQRRLVFDRRISAWANIDMQLFTADFSDGLTAEIRVNPEFGSVAMAEIEAAKYGESIGRLPKFLRADMASVTIHQGVKPFGGGNNNILIHTGQAERYADYLEEILVHEATHTSLDADHANTAEWLDAQQTDGNFISTYARDFPNREDVAESLLPWFAVRYRGGRIDQSMSDTIKAAIPNRLSYFDQLSLTEPGDFDANGVLDILDINGLISEVAAATDEPRWDLDDDGSVNAADIGVWIRDLKMTWFGDADLDGQFNSNDLIAVFQADKFESGNQATWSEGDWTGDMRFNTADLIIAFQDGGYEQGPRRTIVRVPEPTSAVNLFLGLITSILIGTRVVRRRTMTVDDR